MGTVHQVMAVHSILFTEIWRLNISIKKQTELLVHFAQAMSDKNRQKHIHNKMRTFHNWSRN